MLASLVAIGPLSSDMYLASLPDIAKSFAITTGEAQLTLSIYLIGWACSMLIVGPLSDKYGRKPVIVVGLIVYSFASFSCIFSSTIEWLILSRLFQSFGVAASTVVARAIVRDIYKGEYAARILSMMGASMAVVPALAPILGGYLHTLFFWQASFIFMASIGLVELLVILYFLKETFTRSNATSLSIRAVLNQYGSLLSNKIFIGFIACLSFGVAGSFTFVSSSSFVLQGVYGISPDKFGYYFGVVVLGFIAGSFFGAKLTIRLGIINMVKIGSIVAMLSGVIMGILPWVNVNHVSGLILPQVLYYFSIGIISPQSTAGALSPQPVSIAGKASSLISFFPVALGSIVGYLATRAFDGTQVPMASTLALMGVLTYLSYATMIKGGNIRFKADKFSDR